MIEPVYTGVGARKTPNAVLTEMERIGEKLANMQWVLRSGGAEGADHAFERGCNNAQGMKQIYIPWNGFNGYTHGRNGIFLLEISERVKARVWGVHPNPDALTQAGWKLHGRNVYQIFGPTLNSPTKFVLCWTPEGKEVGGTATAIRIAKQNKIPVINMAHGNWEERLDKLVSSYQTIRNFIVEP